MIALKYINKNAATVAAIRDYNNMRFIINNTPQEIKDVYEKMTSPRTPKLSGMPSERNPQAGADKLAAQLDRLTYCENDILRRWNTCLGLNQPGQALRIPNSIYC